VGFFKAATLRIRRLTDMNNLPWLPAKLLSWRFGDAPSGVVSLSWRRDTLPVRVLPPKKDRPRLALWMFFLAWLIGNFALIAGFEGAQGLPEIAFALCIFAIACSAWWGAYRLSNFRSLGGFVVIALWLLGPLIALFDFHDSIRNPFFWGSTVFLLLLLGVAMLVKPRHEPTGEGPG